MIKNLPPRSCLSLSLSLSLSLYLSLSLSLFLSITLFFVSGGREVIKAFLLVGAERERKLLERLLHKRAEFTGQPMNDFTLSNSTSPASTSTTGILHSLKIFEIPVKTSSIIFSTMIILFFVVKIYYYTILNFFNFHTLIPKYDISALDYFSLLVNFSILFIIILPFF